MAIKVSLRQKQIKGNRQSLYLDFYPAIPNPKTGRLTRREFLGMYIFDKATNPIDKQHNKETLQLAKQIRQKRENELNKPEIYTAFEKERIRIKELGEMDFVEYFTQLANKRKKSNHDNWMAALNYLNDFTNGSLKFADLNEKFGNGFRDYLLTTKSRRSSKAKLAQNSALSYFNKFKATLKQAFKDGILQSDLNAKIPAIKEAETKREHLTHEELQQLAKTPCNNKLLKRAALFSALTGLRFSDIQKLVWGEIEFIKEQGHVINFTQQKTKGIEYQPINEDAFELLGEQGEPHEKPFEGLKYSAYHNKHLFQWIGAAGITKNITFHCFRHTFAVLQLSKGTTIYTLSTLLGHRDLKTTQIYAKVVDQTKRDAVNRIKLNI